MENHKVMSSLESFLKSKYGVVSHFREDLILSRYYTRNYFSSYDYVAQKRSSCLLRGGEGTSRMVLRYLEDVVKLTR